MDLRKVKQLIKVLKESSLTEIEVHEGNESVRVRQEKQIDFPVIHQVPKETTAVGIKNPGAPIASSHPINKGHIVRSPYVGVLHLTSSPKDKPFIALGDKVEIGDILCIIDIMETANAIKSEYAGRIIGIFAEDGQGVEFDQELFRIE